MTLSFDLDDLEGTNFYFPIWWNDLDLFGNAQSELMSELPSLSEMSRPRHLPSRPPKFCAIVANNPHPMRLHALKQLQRLGPVDSFGRAFGRRIKDKGLLKGQYRFMLCFENDLYPGYVTEKPFQSWALGSVPLWWGSDPGGYINPGSVVNAANFSSLYDFVDYVADLEGQADRWRTLAQSPILQRRPDLTQVQAAMKELLNAAE